jgi:hypothetical protein
LVVKWETLKVGELESLMVVRKAETVPTLVELMGNLWEMQWVVWMVRTMGAKKVGRSVV